jgi:hypothetical protein
MEKVLQISLRRTLTKDVAAITMPSGKRLLRYKTIREITVKTNQVAGNRLKAALAVMAFSIMHCSLATASDTEPSAIDNTMTCFREQGLQFSDLTRRQNNPAYRTVQTTQGTERSQ